MSEVTSTSTYVFHTDLGMMQTVEQVVSNYDVEDVVQDRAFSQAQELVFQNTAKKVSVNAPIGPRTIRSSYLQEV